MGFTRSGSSESDTDQHNYELSEGTKNFIDQAYTDLDKELYELRGRFTAQSEEWRCSDAGSWVEMWLKDMTQLRDAMMIAEWNTNPLTDSCVQFDQDGNEIDQDDQL